MGSSLKPQFSVSDAYRYLVAVPWFFTTAAAANPTVFSANILSVTREQTAGGEDFFRVTLREAWDQTVTTSPSVEVSEGTPLAAEYGLDYVPSGGSARDARKQLDIIVQNIDTGAPTNTLSARKISGVLWADHGTL